MHLAHASYFGGTLDYEMWKRFANASDLFHQEMFLNLDGMKELTMSDGLELIRQEFGKVWIEEIVWSLSPIKYSWILETKMIGNTIVLEDVNSCCFIQWNSDSSSRFKEMKIV